MPGEPASTNDVQHFVARTDGVVIHLSGRALLVAVLAVVGIEDAEPGAVLVVDEVLGFRRFSESEFSGDAPPTVVRCERYLAGAFRRGPEQWPVLSLRQLVESPSFQEAAA